MSFLKSFTTLCVLLTVCSEIGQTNCEYFPPEGEDSVITPPSKTQIIWALVGEENGKFAFHRQPLPSPIEDLRALAYDTVKKTFIFSGGDPNQLISFNKEWHKFEVVADDVGYVSAMETDPKNNLLYLVDAGKKTQEVMDLKTYKRKVVEENVTYNDIGLSSGPPKMQSNSPYVQREKMMGKVFTKIEHFSGETPQSVFLGRNSVTDTMIFASWDGTQVTIEKKVGYFGNLNGLEIEGDVVKDVIYCSNINGEALVAI